LGAVTGSGVFWVAELKRDPHTPLFSAVGTFYSSYFWDTTLALGIRNGRKTERLGILPMWPRAGRGARRGRLGECPVSTSLEYDGVDRGKAAGRVCWTVKGAINLRTVVL